MYEGGGHDATTSITGVTIGVDVSGAKKVWRTFQAIGDIAFAYAYSTVLIEIQASPTFITLSFLCFRFTMQVISIFDFN